MRIVGQHEEKVMAFSTRLNGQANLCDFLIECPTCNQDISFKEKLLMYQIMRGLSDTTAQERILEAAAQVEGRELSLTRVIKQAEAFKMGKASQEMVNSAGQICRISEYQL